MYIIIKYIQAFFINKNDSAYKVHGDAWLYVRSENEKRARFLLENSPTEFDFEFSKN